MSAWIDLLRDISDGSLRPTELYRASAEELKTRIDILYVKEGASVNRILSIMENPSFVKII